MKNEIACIVFFCLLSLVAGSEALAAEQTPEQISQIRQKIKFIQDEIDYLQDKYSAEDKKWITYKQNAISLAKSCEKRLDNSKGNNDTIAIQLKDLQKCLEEQHKKIPLTFPSGPAGPGRFGAYYTRLKYSLSWDKPWRVHEHPDVVVRFDNSPCKFVFWRGTCYIPCWVTENDIWYNNEFCETLDKHTASSQEPLSDIYCRYSHVRILENTDARVVVHWRYALSDYYNRLAHQDPVTGWNDWADEYYYIYPNGIAMRKIMLYSSRLDVWHEFQESIVISPPGTFPDDNINLEAVTAANLKGESKTFSWADDGDRNWRNQPEETCIEVINLKSEYKPFLIVPPEKTMLALFGGSHGESKFNVWCGPVREHKVNPDHPSPALSYDQPTHACLSWFIKELKPDEAMYNFATVGWQPYEQKEQSLIKLLLNGLTQKTASELAILGKSWLNAPELKLLDKGFISEGYDQTQLAFVLTNSKKAKNPVMKFTILASEESPLVDPSFVIKDWGEADAGLKINGQEIQRGKKFRCGHRREMQGTDLIVWLELESVKPIEMEFVPVGK